MVKYNDVIKQFKRMCWYYSRDKRQKNCPICTSYPNCNIGQCRKIAFEQPTHFADTVMRWAKENLEPVYPTWGEWLNSLHVVGVHAMQAPSQNVYYPIEGKMNTPIPADIAEKLGIEPKK